LNKTIKNKQKQGAYYQQLFADYAEIVQTPLESVNSSENHYWVFGILLKKENMRDKLMHGTAKKSRELRRDLFFGHYTYKMRYPRSLSLKKTPYQSSEQLGTDGLYIPIGPHIKRKHQEFIVKVNIRDFTFLIKDFYSLK
jgi:dTDP-4-amino-4,6-dideoxygalactose transaminase